jgi:hypothetical protein
VKFFGRLTHKVRDGTGLIVEALIDASAIPSGILLKAAKKLANAPIGEMHTSSGGAGYLVGVDIRNGALWLRARLTDGVAALKAAHAVYTGLSVEGEETRKGFRIFEVSLVDRPLEKGSSHAGDYVVLCKLFQRPREMATRHEMLQRNAAQSLAAARDADIRKAEERRASNEETLAAIDRELLQLHGGDQAAVAKRRAEDAVRAAGPPIDGEQAFLAAVRAQRHAAVARAAQAPDRYGFERWFHNRAVEGSRR